MSHPNLLGEPRPTLLPADHPDSDVAAALADGQAPADLAARHPSSSLAWAVLSEQAAGRGEWVAAYAFARTGYHRGLDALRRSGWKGHGPVPFEHEPNRGVLRAIRALGQAAGGIGEDDEAQRCATLLHDSDPTAEERIAATT
ncbi:DUF3151 domain-containing protein [Thalassiella azotivora]